MSYKHVLQVDADTGELLHGTMVWFADKPQARGNFVKTYQDGLVQLAALRLTGETYSVMLYLMGRLSYDNWINVTQADIGKKLGIAQPNVARAMKVLLEKSVILEGPRKGRCHTYRLNCAVGYKGDEGRQTKGGFKVLDGGKANQKPAPENAGPPGEGQPAQDG
jgi:hypothetical protein